MTELRDRYPNLWGVRLLLGIAVLGLVLSGMWRGEIHAHDAGGLGHAQHQLAASADGDTGSQPDVPVPESLHVHYCSAPALILGSPVTVDGLLDVSSSWAADELLSPPPSSPQSTPHRPPIV